MQTAESINAFHRIRYSKAPIKYLVLRKGDRQWLIREAQNMDAALDAIASSRLLGSVGQKDMRDETWVGGEVTVLADVVQINSDGTERQPYTEAY